MGIKRIILIEALASMLVLCGVVPVFAKETISETKAVVGENGEAIWDDKGQGLAFDSENDIQEPGELALISHDAGSTIETIMNMDIVALDGNTYHISDFSEDYIVILFGRSTCGNTRGMADTAAKLRDKGASLKLIIMDVDDTDDWLAAFASENKAIGSLNPPYNDRIMWNLLYAENLASGSVMLPGSFVLDKSRNLIYCHTGIDASGLKDAIKVGSGGGTEEGDNTVDEISAYPFKVQYGQTEARSMLSEINMFRTSGSAWAWDPSNSTRVEYGYLDPLTYDYGLERDAMQRAAEIAISYSHTRPDGSRPFTAYTNQSYGMAGENIAAGYLTETSVFTAWREDNEYYEGQGHRRNMLSDRVEYVGIGHVYYQGYHYWVQEFSGSATDLTYTEANDRSTTVYINIACDNMKVGSMTASPSSLKVYEFEYADLPKLKLTLRVNDHWPGGGKVKTGKIAAQWTSSDPYIAQISGNQVQGLAKGKAVLSCSICGKTKRVVVKVKLHPGF